MKPIYLLILLTIFTNCDYSSFVQVERSSMYDQAKKVKKCEDLGKCLDAETVLVKKEHRLEWCVWDDKYVAAESLNDALAVCEEMR